MIVDRKWPTWNCFAIFGEEYSMMTFLPLPMVLEPYSGWWEGVLYVRSVTCVRTFLMRVGVRQVKWRKALSEMTDSTHSSDSNCEKGWMM